MNDDVYDRIEKLKRQASAISNDAMVSGVSADCPPDVEETFWKGVLAFENAPTIKPLDILLDAGVILPAPEALDDATLAGKLWEAIRGLEALAVCIHSTDHLSDRELYERLWREVLTDPMELMDDDGWWHVDLAGSGSEEDILAFLTYYADDEQRRRWAEDYPDHPMPQTARRPFDRDRFLPIEWSDDVRMNN